MIYWMDKGKMENLEVWSSVIKENMARLMMLLIA